MDVVTFGQGRLALRFGGQKINLHRSADLCFLTGEPLDAWTRRLAAASVPIIEGPVKRTGALGAIESIYVRDPDGNLLEIARQLETAADALAPIREWLRQWQACVRAVDFEGGRRLCAPGMIAFGTVAHFVEGVDRVMEQQWRHVWPRIRDFTVRVDEARGAVRDGAAWVAAPWDSLGVRPDGMTFPRPGRLTIAFVKSEGRWLATHTHFSLSPQY